MVVERYDYIKRKRFTEPQTWTYEWDGAGQLIAVSNNEQKDMGGKPVRLRFEYDASVVVQQKLVFGVEARTIVSHASWGMEIFPCMNGRMRVANLPRPN